uniref:Uncharacterized protein n=1 Tax=Knipowitschia caucasica TaxID=637954 RepID=A0AAV2JY50_KNICA
MEVVQSRSIKGSIWSKIKEPNTDQTLDFTPEVRALVLRSAAGQAPPRRGNTEPKQASTLIGDAHSEEKKEEEEMKRGEREEGGGGQD